MDQIAWAARLEAAVARALRDVVSAYPFPAGEHRIGPPQPDAALDGVPVDLAGLLRTVGPVSLPDLGNGLFLHAADGLRFARIPGKAAVVVFGSNGGGDLYALALAGGRVYRIRESEFLDGVFRGPGVDVIAAGLDEFLERFVTLVEEFAIDGRTRDL